MMDVQHLLLLLAQLQAVNSLYMQCLYRKLSSVNNVTETSVSSYVDVTATECLLRYHTILSYLIFEAHLSSCGVTDNPVFNFS